LGKDFAAGLVDILQEQDLDIFCSEWLEVLSVHWDCTVESRAVAGWGMEGGAGGGSEEGGIVLTRTDISCV
jgi:hypothetical protein